MTLNELYTFSIEVGMSLDPRGEGALREHVAAQKAEYEGLCGRDRALFDQTRLTNPFGDTRIVCGDPRTLISRIACGIDIDAPEILMADRMRDHGRPVDAVVAHHTSNIGGGLGSRMDTIWPQVAMATDFGVPVNIAEKLVRKGGEGDQRSHNMRVTQVAEALGMPLITIHSPADLHILHEGLRVLQQDQPRTVGDLADISDSWPEVQWLIERGKGTDVAVGDRRDPLGKVFCVFYGGWNPSPELFEALCDAGCGTLWVVATSEALNEVARRRNCSIVVTPHYPADNIGLNMLFDAAMDRFGDFDVVDCSNFARIDRRGD